LNRKYWCLLIDKNNIIIAGVPRAGKSTISHRLSKEFGFRSEYTEVPSPTPSLSGLGVGVVRTGITHSFFGIGALDHVQTLSGSTYTLITASQYPPLGLYVGDATYAQMWIDASDRSIVSLPVKLDYTGIYFTLQNNLSNLPEETILRFTVALVLLPS